MDSSDFYRFVDSDEIYHFSFCVFADPAASYYRTGAL